VFPPATPLTAHSTAVFAVPVTVAVYCEDAPSSTLLAPLIAIVIGDEADAGGAGAATSVTVTLCDVVVFSALVAVILILEDAGIVAGAL
jgi:hypothetical protein